MAEATATTQVSITWVASTDDVGVTGYELLRDGAIVANGGRVLAATGRGATLAHARERAYALAEAVEWPDGFFRRDIGWRAL